MEFKLNGKLHFIDISTPPYDCNSSKRKKEHNEVLSRIKYYENRKDIWRTQQEIKIPSASDLLHEVAKRYRVEVGKPINELAYSIKEEEEENPKDKWTSRMHSFYNDIMSSCTKKANQGEWHLIFEIFIDDSFDEMINMMKVLSYLRHYEKFFITHSRPHPSKIMEDSFGLFVGISWR